MAPMVSIDQTEKMQKLSNNLKTKEQLLLIRNYIEKNYEFVGRDL